MKTVCYFLLVSLLVACHRDSSDTVRPEYDDWYTLRSPDNRAIEAVWGDIDKTVVISTGFTLYRTTDRGRNWQQVFSQTVGLMGLGTFRDTLFVTTGLKSLGNKTVLTNPALYSLDLGQTWQPYRRFNPNFDLAGYSGITGIQVSPVAAANGTTYRIRRNYLDDSTKSVRRFTTPGVVTQTGRQINLPKLHQLQAVALDENERLYVAGSDEVCEMSPTFRFCNGGRGVVYVSKKPLP
ncbi:hypothetical protein ACAW74_03235 [Fibrella sp. WM1]|uniref:hypothetical protein n=1 Tax=Fibrella musci TaxID=3242485 RepID=UPI003522B08C